MEVAMEVPMEVPMRRRFRRFHRCLVMATAVTWAACNGAETGDPISSVAERLEGFDQASGVEALLQAVSPVSDRVVWVSGHEGTYLRTTDGGGSWEAGTVPGGEELQFRDVAAFDASTAYLMSSGPGTLSRIYRTDDAGGSWTLQYTADHEEAFLDCMDFWSPERGLVYGDAVDGVPFILSTEDGGATWTRVPADVLPAALEGEGGFAASGTCLDVAAEGRAYIATGNGDRPRVLYSLDFGASWEAADVPVVGGSASGLTTIRMSVNGTGIALGGSIGSDSIRSENVATTTDGGRTWQEGGTLAMLGPVYGSAIVSSAGDGEVVIAVGPRGLDASTDGGRSWRSIDSRSFWAVGFASPESGWAVGPGGRIMRLVVVDD